MGLSEREYMRSPEEPTVSGSTLLLIVLAVIAVVFLGQRITKHNHHSIYPQGFDQQLVEDLKELDPEYKRRKKLAEISPVDLNTATMHDLSLLPRVSDRMAHDMTLERPYFNIEQLDNVYRIGPKTVEYLRPHVTVNPKTLKQSFPNASPPDSNTLADGEIND